MKLKDHPKFPPKLCWRQDGERKRGQYDPINFIIPVGDEKLAGNLLQTAQKFVEKTFGDLVEADVTNEMLLTS